MVDVGLFQQFSNTFFFNNSIKSYLIALVVFIILWVIFHGIRKIILYKLNQLAKKTENHLDNVLISEVNTLNPLSYAFLAFYIAIHFLTLNSLAQKIIDVIFMIWVVYEVILILRVFINFGINKKFKQGNQKVADSALNVLKTIITVILWIIGLIFILANLGVNVTSFIAGLGIGGIAIALALQSILSDLFSSFAIFLDKPFKEGDFIIVGDKMGTVKKIGIKTTRIDSLYGEQIVLSNQYLTSAQIQNYSPMKKRRVTFGFGIKYETPTKTIKKISGEIKRIIESLENTTFDRAHFKEFGDSALRFEVVYYVTDPDYNLYMDIQQKINLEIMTFFEKEKTSFAHPLRIVNISNK